MEIGDSDKEQGIVTESKGGVPPSLQTLPLCEESQEGWASIPPVPYFVFCLRINLDDQVCG